MKARVTIYMNRKPQYAFSRETSTPAETYMCVFEAAEAMNISKELREDIQNDSIRFVSDIFSKKILSVSKSFFDIERIDEEAAQ